MIEFEDFENQIPLHSISASELLKNPARSRAKKKLNLSTGSVFTKHKDDPPNGFKRKGNRLLLELKCELGPKFNMSVSDSHRGNLRSKYGRLQKFNEVADFIPSDIFRPFQKPKSPKKDANSKSPLKSPISKQNNRKTHEIVLNRTKKEIKPELPPVLVKKIPSESRPVANPVKSPKTKINDIAPETDAASTSIEILKKEDIKIENNSSPIKVDSPSRKSSRIKKSPSPIIIVLDKEPISTITEILKKEDIKVEIDFSPPMDSPSRKSSRMNKSLSNEPQVSPKSSTIADPETEEASSSIEILKVEDIKIEIVSPKTVKPQTMDSPFRKSGRSRKPFTKESSFVSRSPIVVKTEIKRESIMEIKSPPKPFVSIESSFQEGELIWGRLANFPFWPCLVCKDPQGVLHRIIKNKLQLHIRFFGPKGLRSWINIADCFRFNGNDISEELRNGKKVKKTPMSTKLKAELSIAIEDALVVEKEQNWFSRLNLFNSIIDEQERELKEKRRISLELKESLKRRRSLSISSSTTDEEKQLAKKAKVLNGIVFDHDVAQSFSSASSISSSGVSTMKSSDGLSVSSSLSDVKDALDEVEEVEIEVEEVEEEEEIDDKTRLEMDLERIIKAIPLDLSKEMKKQSKGGLCRICTLEEEAEGKGALMRCEGHCCALYHRGCAQEMDVKMDRLKRGKSNSGTIKGRRKKRKNRLKEENNNNSDHLGRIHITGDMPVLTQEVGVLKKFLCKPCETKQLPNCFICHKNGGEDNPMTMCSKYQCARAFHLNCLDLWPQAKKRKEGFICPQHQCHTCISDDPRANNYASKQKLLKCSFCPTSYHFDSNCVPAGTVFLSQSYIICQKHGAPIQEENSSKALVSLSPESSKDIKKTKSLMNLNVNWCFICTRGGNLLCCDLCPSAFHVECLKLNAAKIAWIQELEMYICEECEAGRFPLYGELVWAKFSHYRWWPAVIVTDSMTPQVLQKRTRNRGDFCCKFLGSNDHTWLSRRRVFLYHEDDALLPFEEMEVEGKVGYAGAYHKSLVEARLVNEILQKRKEVRQNAMKKYLRPLPFKKLLTNRAVPPVRMELYYDDDLNDNRCNCTAKEPSPCGSQSKCINRLLMTECQAELCPAGDKCENQRMQKRLYPQLDLVRTETKGWGLVSKEDLKAGDFVVEYVGELINNAEMQKRLQLKQDTKDDVYYFLTLNNNLIIDAERRGNMARFMNHSCEPNCETQKWTVKGKLRVGLFALYDIKKNTELTFNYNWESCGTEKKACFCGAKKCSGFIGDSKK